MRRCPFIPERVDHGQENSALVSGGRKSASITLFMPWMTYFIAFLTCQPRNKPRSQKPDYHSNEGAGNGEPERNRLAQR
jgi:hypothetical protein